MSKGIRIWRLARLVLDIGISAIIAFTGVAAFLVESVSQKQRTALDWNLQEVLSNTDTFMVVAALLSITVLMLFVKTKTFRGKGASSVGRNIEADLMTPIIFMALSFFQGDIFKSAIATLIYAAFYFIIILTILFNLGIIAYITKAVVNSKQ